MPLTQSAPELQAPPSVSPSGRQMPLSRLQSYLGGHAVDAEHPGVHAPSMHKAVPQSRASSH
jgi:hypothetical protein